MEKELKEIYECPTMEVVEIKTEGIVCGSNGAEDYIPNAPVSW